MPTPAPTLERQVLHEHTGERIVLLGTPAIAVPTLEALAASALRPIAVVTEPDKPVGRKHVLTPPPIKQAAERLGLPVSQPASATELHQLIASLQPTLGVVIAYGRILKPELLAIPDHGFVNLHFSLLPQYRGATPIQAAILNGDTETGVTLMQIDPGLDTGAILGYTTSPIKPTHTAGQLAEELAEVAAVLATELIPSYLAGELAPQPQPPSSDSVTKRLTKDDGAINWQWPASQVERFIRAMDPWPRAWTELAGIRVILRRAHLTQEQLVIDELQPANGRPMSYGEFARGYPTALTALEATGKVAPSKSN